MAEITTLATKVQTVRTLFDRYRGDIMALIPKHLTADRFLQIAVTAIRRNPKLADCTPASLLGCVMEAASMGLEVGGMPAEAHLVPFRNTKTGQSDCTLIPDYRGLLKVARQSGEISSIETRVVQAKDKFSYLHGLHQTLDHEPSGDADPGPMVAVYALARLKDGGVLFEVMTRPEVEAIRKRSRAGQEGPWVTDEEAMWRKTVAKRLCKYLPYSRELQKAVALEERAELGIPQEIDLIAEPPPAEPPPPTKLDEAMTKLKGKMPARETPKAPEAAVEMPPNPLTPDEEQSTDPREIVDAAIRAARQRGVKDHATQNYLTETLGIKNPYSLDLIGAQTFLAWAGTVEVAP